MRREWEAVAPVTIRAAQHLGTTATALRGTRGENQPSARSVAGTLGSRRRGLERARDLWRSETQEVAARNLLRLASWTSFHTCFHTSRTSGRHATKVMEIATIALPGPLVRSPGTPLSLPAAVYLGCTDAVAGEEPFDACDVSTTKTE